MGVLDGEWLLALPDLEAATRFRVCNRSETMNSSTALFVALVAALALTANCYSPVQMEPQMSPNPNCPLTQEDCKGEAILNTTSCTCVIQRFNCNLYQENCTHGGILNPKLCKVCKLSKETASCGSFNATFDSNSCSCTGCPIEHEIQGGDTFIKVAEKYQIPLENMKAANPAFWQIPPTLRPGTFMCIPPLKRVGALDKITEGVTECYHKADGTDYRGMRSETVTGLTCQKWSVKTPHPHEFTLDDPVTGLGDHNYCRNPDKKKTAWCYTTFKQREWEYCDIETPDVNCPKGSYSPCMPGLNHCPLHSDCEETGPKTYRCKCHDGYDLCPEDESKTAKCWPVNLCNMTYADLNGCDPRAACQKVSACRVDCTCEWPLMEGGGAKKGALCVPTGSEGVKTVEAPKNQIDLPLGGGAYTGDEQPGSKKH